MTTKKVTPGAGIKDQIKDQSPDFELLIRDSIQLQLDEIETTAEDVLGELAWPYTGMRCPAIWSIGESSGAATDKILAAIIVHFAGKENLEQLPEDLREDTLLTLHHLYKTMQTIGKYGNLLYCFANLYHLKQGRDATAVLNGELNFSYGHHNKA